MPWVDARDTACPHGQPLIAGCPECYAATERYLAEQRERQFDEQVLASIERLRQQGRLT